VALRKSEAAKLSQIGKSFVFHCLTLSELVLTNARNKRAGRDLMVQESIIADLREPGCELESVAEPDLMANDSTHILVRQMMGAVAQYRKSLR